MYWLITVIIGKIDERKHTTCPFHW
jgi:hypothetical protein